MDPSEYWNKRAQAWAKRMDDHANLPDLYGSAAITALDVRPGEKVLDIGCGQGITSVDLAERVGPTGHVVGVDISQAMIDGAVSRLAGQSRAVEFRVGDAAIESFEDTFDAVFSRFGVMFFPNPDDAFGNISSVLRRGGRLAWVVWGPLSANPWATVPTIAAAQVLGFELERPEPGSPGPFSLGDTDQLTAMLTTAGFGDVAFSDITQPRKFPPESALEELATWLTIGTTGDAFSAADPGLQLRASEAALAAIEPYREADGTSGWALPALARVVTATKL
ncbi:MAG: class I SAM-dependent methyltransferase [Microthrixaceae bacterium]